MTAKKTDKPQKTTKIKRVFKDQFEFTHDLYKLNPAEMKKNISFNEIPNLQDITHMHFFHSVDSSGIKQTNSTTIGGHFHEMEIIESDDGSPAEVRCKSGPLTYGYKKIMGRKKRVPVPTLLDEDGTRIDNHTHFVEYIKSDVLKLRTLNQEAIKTKQEYYNREIEKSTPPEGIKVG